VRRAAFLLALAFLLPACAPLTPSQRAGSDQEITRDILWAYQRDKKDRFRDVRVSCVDQEVLVDGRVSDAEALTDALELARAYARSARVRTTLEVRPR
jgi:osmotically-inducible protein OsmY